jgi:50S ribosomal subunit-associated GTPase HflX
VYNKADRLEPEQRAAFERQAGVCVSALDGNGMDALLAALIAAAPTTHQSSTSLADVG